MKMPPRETITPTTPLRLEAAAQLAYPDGSMSVSALRRLAAAEKLTHERIAGKYYVTLAAIEEMRERCRVPAKAPELSSKDQATDDSQPSSSETDSSRVALAAMNAIAERAKGKLRTPSAVDAANAIAEELKERLRPRRSKNDA